LKELFPIAVKVPQGFSYVENFLTSEEEQQVLAFIKTIDLHPMMFQGFEAKRKVASFGFDYSFERKQLTRGKEIPVELHWLVQKVADHTSLPFDSITEVLITEYPVGSVINWHRDAPPFDTIVGISLLSDCIFKLRPHEKAKQTRKATVSLPVERRSLYMISGESRNEWQHSIAPVKEVRYSITMRTVKSKAF
jgi:alkylated DNA repair dioxygenase AlkB